MADSDSIDAIVSALYETISGPAGAPRDWDRLRALFLPGARLVRSVAAANGQPQAESLTVEEFIQMAEAYIRAEGFYESEIARRTESFGSIAQVFSTYAARLSPNGPPLARGINSIQLFTDGARWWVVNMLWDTEREGTAIPSRYLPEPRPIPDKAGLEPWA